MAYKRRSRFYYFDNYGSKKTKISIHWSMKASAYSIYFHKEGKWFPSKERFKKIQEVLIQFINNLPYGEKEKVVKIDIVNNEEVQDWTYFIAEKHLNNFRNLVEMMSEDFEVDFIEKPVETSSFTSKFTPTEVWLDRFKEITGENINGMDINSSRRIYRRMCMSWHPDRNPNNKDIAEKMSQLNEIWTNLEYQYFKTKKMPEQEKEPCNA